MTIWMSPVALDQLQAFLGGQCADEVMPNGLSSARAAAFRPLRELLQESAVSSLIRRTFDVGCSWNSVRK